MKPGMDILDSGRLDPTCIMAKDASLLEEIEERGRPVLHLYDWNVPCLTYGYFTDPSLFLDLEKTSSRGICLAKRPTGGGIIFHLTDFAFSVIIPAGYPALSKNTLQNYSWINQCVARVVSQLFLISAPSSLLSPCLLRKGRPSFCMAEPTPYDVMISGRKAGGAAQRRTNRGLLHQATLSLSLPPFSMVKQILKDTAFLHAMKANSYCFIKEDADQSELNAARKMIKDALSSSLPELFQAVIEGGFMMDCDSRVGSNET